MPAAKPQLFHWRCMGLPSPVVGGAGASGVPSCCRGITRDLNHHPQLHKEHIQQSKTMLERNENFLTTGNPVFPPALYLALISSPNGNNLQDPNYRLTAWDRRGNGTVKLRKQISSVLCQLSCRVIHVRQ